MMMMLASDTTFASDTHNTATGSSELSQPPVLPSSSLEDVSVTTTMTPPSPALPSVRGAEVTEPAELITKESVQRSIQFVGHQLNQLWHNREEISKRSLTELHRFTGITKQVLTDVSQRIQEGVQTRLQTSQTTVNMSTTDDQRLWQKRERSDAARRVAFDRLKIVLESDREQLTEETQARIHQDIHEVLSRYLTLDPSDIALEVVFLDPLDPANASESLNEDPTEVMPSIHAHVTQGRQGKRRKYHERGHS
jgi:septum formation topological specificity factor MinE